MLVNSISETHARIATVQNPSMVPCRRTLRTPILPEYAILAKYDMIYHARGSSDRLASLSGGDDAGSVWGSPPGKRGAALLEGMVHAGCACLRCAADGKTAV